MLLGPQGTLYGAGTLAGAVRYLPRRPDTRRRTLEVRGDLFALAHGGAPGSDAGLTFNLPVVERKLALRGSVDRYADPGFIDYDYLLRTPGVSEPEPDLSDPEAVAANLRSQPDANTEDTLSARLSLLWNPRPNLSALFAYQLQDQRVGARQVNHARSFDTGRHVSAHRYLEPNDRKNELLSLELTWAPGAVELTSAAGYSRFSQQGQRDQTDLLIQAFGIAGLLPGTFPALARAQALDPGISVFDLTSRFRSFSAYTREDSREERLNWETRLVSTGDGPWRWVGGVFFNRYDSHGTSLEYAPGLSAFSGVTPILSGRPVSEPVEYYSLGVQAALIRPDATTNYEVGVRRSWDNERLTFSGTLFHVDWTDIQVAGLTPFSAEPITSYTRAALSVDSPGLLDGGADAFKGDGLSGAPRQQGSRAACSRPAQWTVGSVHPGNAGVSGSPGYPRMLVTSIRSTPPATTDPS